ncbi:MAG: acyl--CoA ligase [Streptosporangiales bacterium]|nr:acyl--CoA ligase [Streptosporangiales bacterium]
MLNQSLSQAVAGRAAAAPDQAAYLSENGPLTWSEYDGAARRLAGSLAARGLAPGDRVAVWLPDSPRLHVAYLACERAGLITVGVPERAGNRELTHLVATTGASLLITPSGRAAPGGIPHAVLRGDATLDIPGPPRTADTDREPVGPDELWLLNSTSGTTGLPKCVQQVQRKWSHLASQAIVNAALTAADVIMSAVPSPFGYGLWTAHFLPPMLGIPCVLRERFDASETLRAAAAGRVTVLACVTTQLRMMLASPLITELDWSALRVTYTGGEHTPPEVLRAWERITGSTVLQFYGSNEFGGFSGTALTDGEEARRTTAGRVLPGVTCRLYDDSGADVTAAGGPGQPGGTGPGTSRGYYEDPDADAELFGPGGLQLLPDLVTVDDGGYVRVSGRKADIIIRGGKNISAATVEAEVAAHPDVAQAAAVSVPDAVYGERVCAAVTLRDRTTLTLEELRAFLAGRGVSKEYFPEHVVVLEEMPVSAGGKVARKELRATVLASMS